MITKTIKFNEKKFNKLFNEYHDEVKRLVDQSFNVIKDELISHKVIDDCHIGNNKGLYDCDGLYYDICDVDEKNRYKFVFDIGFEFTDDGLNFWLKFNGMKDPLSSKIHKFLNRNKKKILGRLDPDFMEKLVKVSPVFHESLREYYQFRDA